MQLAFGVAFSDLYTREGLARLDRCFVLELAQADIPLHDRFVTARTDPKALAPKEHSQLLIDLAPHLEDFVARLFGIEAAVRALGARHQELVPLFACKRLFVQRRAAKAHSPADAATFDGPALGRRLAEQGADPADELAFAKCVMGWLEEPEPNAEALDLATRYAAWAVFTPEGGRAHAKGRLFRVPHRLDPLALVPAATEVRDGVTVLKRPDDRPRRERRGFKLTDPGGDLVRAMDEANYCIFCHNQGKDSCSKGLREKDGAFKQNPLGIILTGCPLDEKISEMHTLKSEGSPIGALAVVTVDNPMCAGTGHRICNDCMKSCIYQKQDPVDIPIAETRTLDDVLELPYGFEIYALLTRWNPLNLERPLPRAESGYKVLVAGLGPAGYTLAHHLLNDGHTVVGVDGLKIEPLPQEVSGVTPTGERVPFKPIASIDELYEELDDRILAGFGGVAEYGITVRWDKNYLKVLRLLLERRSQFAMFGGVRFGSTIDRDGAFALGFDHVALCMGAGRPTVIDMPNGLARGVRTASDFLMGLQLTGAAKAESIANLQLRLPAVVIGGGLTAIDTSTEALAYYPVQVEKFLTRYEALCARRGEPAVRARWDAEETQIADEFLDHAKAIRAEREAAQAEGREPRIGDLLDAWGGVKMVYRRRLIDAPSYRLNHEEIGHAFDEGIAIAENLEPAGVEIDQFGHAQAIRLKKADSEETLLLPARTILIAAGTNPNTVLQRENPAQVQLDGKFFRALDEEGTPASPKRIAKPGDVHVLMSVADDGRAVSFFGDLHPSFNGNVVKAMGGAKQGYPVVSRVLARRTPARAEDADRFLARMAGLFVARVHEVNRLTPNIVEVVVHAPLAARGFHPGQFYRLQNYEANALRVNGTVPATTLAMEGLALTGAWTDPERGLVSTIVLEMGGSSDLCAHLKPGEPVVMMGPTGTPTEITPGETVVLVGGGLGNAVLFSIGRAFREAGSKVLYFAGYKKLIDRYKVEEIERAADVVVWCSDEAPGFPPGRPQDRSFHGNIVEAMRAYASGALGERPIPMEGADRLIAIGSDRMMAAVGAARHGVLKPFLKPAHHALGSINSPMQCMMKEICAQCLQEHVDPDTGKRTYVYSCFNQDQALDRVSFPHLNQRLRQNGAQEKLTAQWIDACLAELELRAGAR
jgi:NADPH-dependent glutamate synthase beta subunit-like oxidoreductase/NAD(P)H-flavin reductase